MDRTFEATFDDQGHFDMPADFRERHGFTPGAKVKIEEQEKRIVIEPADNKVESANPKMTMTEAIEKAVGFSGSNGDVLKILLEERKRF